MAIEQKDSLLDHFDEVSEGTWKRDKKFLRLVLKSKDDPYNTSALWNTDWLLEKRYNNIIRIFIKNKEMNKTEAAKTLLKEERYMTKLPDIDEEDLKRRIENYIDDLLKWGLLKVSKVEIATNFGNPSPYYQLSLNGMFYVIENYGTGEIMYIDFFKDLIKNHIDNILFTLFVLPYFDKKTIVSSVTEDPGLVLWILSYLKEICERIIQNKRLIRGLRISGYDDKSNKLHLFHWPLSNPEKDSIFFRQFDNFRSGLRPFLIEELRWEWIKNAKILPDYDNRKITFETHMDPSKPYIVVDIENMKSYLKADKLRYDFIVEENNFNNTLNISSKTTNAKALIEKIKEDFKKTVLERLANLIFMIMNREYRSNNQIKTLLSQDRKFRKAIEDIISIINIPEQ